MNQEKPIKTVDQILSERKFSPVEKLVELYEEIEGDANSITEQFGELPTTVKIDVHKLREKTLSSIMKCKQVEDGHRIKLAEIANKDPNKGDGNRKQGIILQRKVERLPNGKKVVKSIEVEIEQEEGT